MAESGSFIPKQQPRTNPKVRRRRVYVVNYVVFTFFLCVLLTAGGLLVWEWRLNTQLDTKQAALNDLRTQFEPRDLVLVKEVEAKLNTISQTLDSQPATSKLFLALNNATLQSVQLQNFTIAPGALPNSLLVTYVGVTDSYDAVLAQRRALEAAPVLAEAEVVGVSYDASGITVETEAAAGDDPTAEGQQFFEDSISFSVSIELPMEAIGFSGDLPTAEFDLVGESSAATLNSELTGTAAPAITPDTDLPAS